MVTVEQNLGHISSAGDTQRLDQRCMVHLAGQHRVAPASDQEQRSIGETLGVVQQIEIQLRACPEATRNGNRFSRYSGLVRRGEVP